MAFDIKMKNANVRASAKPLSILAFIIVLGILTINYSLKSASAKNILLRSVREQELVLSEKLDSIKQNPLGSLESVNNLVIALPEKNPIMVMISQLKRYSTEKNILVNSLEVSGLKEDTVLSSVSLTVGLGSADLMGLLNFVNEIPSMAPVSSIYEIRVTPQGEEFQSQLSMDVYWSEFPQTIPAISESLDALTDDQIKVVEAASALKIPEYQTLDPVFSEGRENPFN